jgi:dihydrofolate reductase
MGKIINSTYITLDGDISNLEQWHFDYFDEDAVKTASELLFGSDAVIMGRETYEGFAPAWSTRSGDEYTDRMNAIDKYVVSTTLTDPTWNNTTVINGDVAGEIRALKERTERSIVQYGFGAVSRLMLEHGLLDELHLWVHPVLSGRAKPEELIYRDFQQTSFDLAGTHTHASGVVVLKYAAKPAA